MSWTWETLEQIISWIDFDDFENSGPVPLFQSSPLLIAFCFFFGFAWHFLVDLESNKQGTPTRFDGSITAASCRVTALVWWRRRTGSETRWPVCNCKWLPRSGLTSLIHLRSDVCWWEGTVMSFSLYWQRQQPPASVLKGIECVRACVCVCVCVCVEVGKLMSQSLPLLTHLPAFGLTPGRAWPNSHTSWKWYAWLNVKRRGACVCLHSFITVIYTPLPLRHAPLILPLITLQLI